MINFSSDTYLGILDTINEGVRILDEKGIIVYANQALCKLLGYEKTELIGKSVFDLYQEKERNRADELFAQRKAGRDSRYETCFFTKSGRKLFTEVSANPVFDDQGNFKASFTIIHDITQRRQLEKDIVGERDFLNNLISLCPDGVIGVSKEGKIIIFNRAAENLTRYKAEDVIDKMHVADIYKSIEQARLIKKHIYSQDYGGRGRMQDFEVDIVTKEGKKVPIRLSAILIHKDDQEIGSVGFFHDISDRKRLEFKLRDLSIRDGLSGLFNHRHFHSVLVEEVARAQRYERPLSLICLDLDNFKRYNDTLGHLEGDNIIRLVGKHLKESMRSMDRAFRYGGDEFMVVLPEAAIDKAVLAAERIRKSFNSNWPYNEVCEKYDLKPATLSLGAAEANLKDGPEALIKRADLAMYEAKRAGGDRVVEAGAKIGKDI